MKKLELKKQTIATLTEKEQANVKAGTDDGIQDYRPCWVNLWTLYHCRIYYTGPRPE